MGQSQTTIQRAALILLIGCLTTLPALAIEAFPGAEGFGAKTVGGRGGRVIEVTNLNDSGTGSLRGALEASGPRTVVFRTGGTITLQTGIRVIHPYLTIAGQTAPGGGITLRNAAWNRRTPIILDAPEVIIRHLRIRPGPGSELCDTLDAITINTSNVILDHLSLSWAVDETLNTWDNGRDITIQWCIISETLHKSTHKRGTHSMGVLLGGKNSGNISMHHNLIAHNNRRSPDMVTEDLVDFVNNVVYNYGKVAGVFKDKRDKIPVNYVNNYIKPGPNSDPDAYELMYQPRYNGPPTYFGAEVFVAGNIGPHRPNNSLPEAEVVRPEDRGYLISQRHPAPFVTTTSAHHAYHNVLANAGATLPVRDAVDQRVADDVRHETGRIINHPDEVGGWPQIDTGSAAPDTDHDGMPDDWEMLQFDTLSRGGQNDSSSDFDGDGYTDLEEYLNGTDPKGAGVSSITANQASK